VRAEARRQGYVANLSAGTLRTGRSRIVVAVYDTLAFGQQPIMDAMDQTLAAAGYRLLLCSTRGEVKLEHSAVEWALSISAEGLILRSGMAGREFAERYSRMKLPVVFMNSASSRPRVPCCGSVNFDEEEASAAAAAHLARLGHRRIGLVMNGRYNKLKQSGACNGAREAGNARSECELLHVEQPSDEAIATACLPHFDRANGARCTAFICSGYLISLKLMALARNAGLWTPLDYSIIGFDDTALAEYTQPGLSAIQLPDRELGVAAAEMWLRLREKFPRAHAGGGNGGNGTGTWSKRLKSEFIPRDSSGPAPRLAFGAGGARKLVEARA
jgi:DNA-binding LacI/PurR family transcriptional regulator